MNTYKWLLCAVAIALSIPLAMLVAAPKANEHEAKVFAKTKANVMLLLRDPDSAQFRNLRLLANHSVCGEVNSKNGFGGYVGFKPFFSDQFGRPELLEPNDIRCKAY